MEPGHACITCHAQQGGPSFNIGGTVYPTGHEPDDCNGSGPAGAVVTVTDRNGVTASFTASSVSGNFHGTASLAFPITARVTFQGRRDPWEPRSPPATATAATPRRGRARHRGGSRLPP